MQATNKTIKSSEFKNRFEFVEISNLAQTEELVSNQKLNGLVNTFGDTEASVTPLFCLKDSPSKVIVLDGNHRFLALKKSGFNVAPVFFINKDEFEVEVWDRGLEIIHADKVPALFKELKLVPIGIQDQPQDLKQAIIHFEGKSYAFDAPADKLTQHQKTKVLLNRLAELGEVIENIARTTKEAQDLIQVPGWLVIKLPEFTKNELIEIIRQDKILPPKSFRIVFPTGPIRLPVKVQFLKNQSEDLTKSKRTELPIDLKDKKLEELKYIDFINLPQEVDISHNDKYRALIKLVPVLNNMATEFEILSKPDLVDLHLSRLTAKVVRVIDFKKPTTIKKPKTNRVGQTNRESLNIKIYGHYKGKTVFLHDFNREVYDYYHWESFFEVLEGTNKKPFILIIEGPAVIDFDEIFHIYQRMFNLFRDQGLVYVELDAYVKQTLSEVRMAIPEDYVKNYLIKAQSEQMNQDIS